jgi:glycerophosphoryl diester phosphodiesterase
MGWPAGRRARRLIDVEVNGEGVRAFIAAGMDGFFTDNPDLGVMAARG